MSSSPVVLLEGWNGAGKGSRISDLMYNLDARATSVYVTENFNAVDAASFPGAEHGVGGFYPMMQQFWKALGGRGTITFYDRGWYTSAVQRMLYTQFGEVKIKNGKVLHPRATVARAVREAAEVYGYDCIRMFMLMSHYRSPLNYSGEILMQAKAALERLSTAKDNLDFFCQNGADGEMTAAEAETLASLGVYRQKFCDAMDDDFNTANAISVLFELVRAINIATADENQPTKAGAQACLDMVHEFTDVLGLLYSRKEESLDEKVEQMIADRQAARAAKNWAEADRIRDELKAMGIELKDTKQGVQWKKI